MSYNAGAGVVTHSHVLVFGALARSHRLLFGLSEKVVLVKAICFRGYYVTESNVEMLASIIRLIKK